MITIQLCKMYDLNDNKDELHFELVCLKCLNFVIEVYQSSPKVLT